VADLKGVERKGDWIQVYPSGIQFWPLDPRPEDVHLEDIAHSLSHQCRFAGHCAALYVVADHSIRVSCEVERLARVSQYDEHAVRWLSKLGLMHDSPEAYVIDVPRPLKRHLGGYADFEGANARAIGKCFGLGEALVDLPALVKHVDEVLLATERRDLLKPPPALWTGAQDGQVLPLEERIVPLSPEEARRVFLNRAKELGLASSS
jgi:hypothetical protein